MDKRNKLQEKIDDYLFDLLSEEERIAFEQMMAEDENLRNDVELTRQIGNAFQIKGEKEALKEIQHISSKEELKEIIEAAERKHNEKRSTTTRKLLISISAVAATILILVYIGLQSQYSSQQLFDEYYHPEEYMPTSMRGNNSELSQEQAQKLYDVICMIEKGQPETAIDSLRHFYMSFEPTFKEDVQWNLALAYLKVNQRDNAEKILHEIIKKNGDYIQDAQELSKKIKQKRWF